MTMLGFNLLHPAFGTKISCNKPQVDGYEVENLMKNQNFTLNFSFKNGFMAESFIKPPVNIIAIFPFHVEISKIYIDAKVGCQCSRGFEIYGSSSTVPTSEAVFTLCGKGVCATKTQFCFNNKRFVIKNSYNSVLQKTNDATYLSSFNVCNNIAEFELSHKPPFPMKNMKSLQIRINQVAAGSACCIKTLEIWGQPSSSTNAIAQRLTTDYCITMSRNGNTPLISVDVMENNNGYEDNCLKTDSDIVIPDEYLDPITQEIQIVPMLLPSGHSVDLSTLEKFNKEEAKWGRTPSDPFTGKVFTKHSKPLPNTTLKLSIDQFLLQNPKVKVSSQTLGSVCSSVVQNGLAASKLLNYGKIQGHQNHEFSLKRTISHSDINSCYNEEPSCKYFKTDSSQHVGFSNERQVSNVGNTNIIFNDNDCNVTKVKCHTSQLNASLNGALSQVLQNLPSFTQTSKRSKLISDCVFCKSSKLKDHYKLSCEHFICRGCLVGYKNGVVCPEDHVQSKQHEICKVHIT